MATRAGSLRSQFSGNSCEPQLSVPDIAAYRPDRNGERNLPAEGESVADRVAAPPVLLTVVVPVFNEVATIEQLLIAVEAAPFSKQIVVVDDASTDGTSDVLRGWRDSGRIELVNHTKNRGKGAAIRTGLERARGEYTIIQDADLEYDPQDYRQVIAPLLSGQADVVYGSRRLGRKRSWLDQLNPFYHGVTMLNVCVRFFYGVRLTDEATCYKAFSTDVLRRFNLECERFEFCPEVTAKACRLGLHIHEVPIRYTSRGRREGKKIGLRDGLQAVQSLWRWRNFEP